MRHRPHSRSSRSHDGGGLSRRDVDALYPSLRQHDAFVRSSRDMGSSGVKSAGHAALAAGEVGAGALAMGWLYGRTNHWNLGNTPIPMGLAVGVGAHLLNMFVLGNSSWSPHVANLANGAIGSWTTMLGAGLGTQARQKAGLPTAPITAGCGAPGAMQIGCAPAPMLPPASASFAGSRYGARPTRLTEAEIAALSRQVR